MLYMDCNYCAGTVHFRRGPGVCDNCGARYVISTKGDSLFVNPVVGPGRQKSKKGSRRSSKKASKGRSSPMMKSAKRLFFNFVAVMIFVSCMVIVLATYGGG